MWDFSWFNCYSFHPLFWSSVFIYHTSNSVLTLIVLIYSLQAWSSVMISPHIIFPCFSLTGMLVLSVAVLTLSGSLFSAVLVLMLLSNPLKKPIWKLHWLTRRNPQRTLSTWICLIVREEKPMKKKKEKKKSKLWSPARHLDSNYNIIQKLFDVNLWPVWFE